MAYIAWVRYGTANKGYDEFLTISSLSGALMLSSIDLNPAMRFDSLEAAKEAVHTWCTKRRAELERVNIHNGKAWNQTCEGSWQYREVKDVEPMVTKDYDDTTLEYLHQKMFNSVGLPQKFFSKGEDT